MIVHQLRKYLEGNKMLIQLDFLKKEVEAFYVQCKLSTVNAAF